MQLQMVISVQMLKAWGEAVICGLHVVAPAVWQSVAIPPYWKRSLIVSVKEKGLTELQQCNVTLHTMPGKVLTHLLLMQI